MKLREIFRYEIGYRLRSPATWIYAVLLFFGPLAMAHMSSTANNRVVNAPLHYAEVVNFLGFFAILITTGIFGDAATRDASTGTQALFSTAPVSKLDYLGGRFTASFLVNAALLLGPPLAVALSTQLPWLDHFNWAPFRIAAFAQPYVLFALPNLLISAAVIFTVAVLTRQALATYLGGLGLIVLYLAVANHNWGPPTVDILADPFGLIALERVARFWTPAEQTTRLLGFPGLLVANRAIWLALAVALLVFAYRRFDFGHAGIGGRRRSARGPEMDAEEPVRHAIPLVPNASRDFGVRTRVAQMLAVARHSLADIVRNRVFLVMVAGAVFLVFAFAWEVGAIIFDTATWPVTHLVAGTVLTIPMAIVFAVLTSLVAGELVWKEREVGAGDIAAAAPIPDWVPFAGRFIALVAILAMLQLVLMAAGVTLQVIQGYYRFELGLYVKILFGLNLADYLIFAALAMVVHVVVNHKNLGHIVVVASYLFTLTAAQAFRIRHNLLVYNRDPGWTYSDLNGFGPFVGPFVWFKMYWAAWALLLTVIATVFWVRSTEGGLRARLRLAHLRLAGAAGRAAAVAGLLILTLGGFVFYNTNVLNEYRTPNDVVQIRADYEHAYKKYEDAPQPTIARQELRVEIYPERPAVDIRGSYRLVNASGRPVDTLLVLVDDEVTLRSLELGRPARLVADDAAMRQRVYVLSPALEPGDSMVMRFHTAFARRGFPNAGIPTSVVENGAYFGRDWLPAIGYQPSRELTDERMRKRHGLPPRVEPPSPSDTSARARQHRLGDRDMDPVHMDVVIGTAPDQIAVTPGKLVREWRENGRRYFHYVTESPISHNVPFLSARYAVRRDAWKDVPLRVFYHPTHTFNLDRIVNSMKASLDCYSTHFGPYPYGELRVVEFPRYASFARAHPHTIAFSEGSAFITRIEKWDVDRPFFVVAHETAHQWWGNQLRGARVKGAALLSETLAQYSAMMVMEKTYGADMARRFYDFEMERYLRGRARFSRREVPMVETMTQSHLFYHKGAVAMYTMREVIGEEPLNLALRRFYAKYAGRKPPYPTSLDLVAELRAVTSDSLQPLITDLFETITLWEAKTDSATAKRVGGEWRVTLTVTAKKVRADSIGKETEVPMNDLVEIGVFADAKAGERPGKPLYLRKHRVRNGRQTIVVTVPVDSGTAPVRAGIDPYDRLIVRERERTVVTVRSGGRS